MRDRCSKKRQTHRQRKKETLVSNGERYRTLSVVKFALSDCERSRKESRVKIVKKVFFFHRPKDIGYWSKSPSQRSSKVSESSRL